MVQCRDCEFIFTNPPIEEAGALERAYYDDPARYQATETEGLDGMYDTRLELVARHVNPGRLLDVGAGKGEFLGRAKARGWSVTGVEPSPRFCEHARTTLGIQVHQGFLGSVEALSDQTFDAITLNHVLEHVDEPRALLEYARERLTGEGVLFVEVPNCDSHMTRLVDSYFRLRGRDWSSRLSPVHPPFHKYGHTRRSLRYILEQSGYSIRTLETFSGRGRGVLQHGASRALINFAFSALDRLGNRELLCALAMKR